MAHEAAFILDQLMGRNRDVVPGEGNEDDRDWSDPDVCKYHLCGFCPSELFTNTRSDVGPCDKIHDPLLKKSYEESDRNGKMGYEDDFLEYLESLIRDLDRRIQRGKNRLELSVTANVKAMGMEVGLLNSDRMKELTIQINQLVTKSGELGNEGKIEEARELIREVEKLEKEKEKERSNLLMKANVPHTVAGYEMDPGNFHEKMEMCDLCGCFLVIGDSQSRIDAHLMGKQHLGFSRIRTTIAELKNKKREASLKRREDRMRRSDRSISPRGSHDRGRERSKEQHQGRHGNRSYSRERSRRERGRRSRSRSRDRRHRSRSREHRNRYSEHRNRSREHGNRSKEHRSRSRERRSRSRERRSRSRERRNRSREHRSRSREHKNRSRERRSRSRERRGRSREHRSRSREHRRRSRSRSKGRQQSRSRSRDRRRSQSREKKHKKSHDQRQSRSKNHHSQAKDRHRSQSKERPSSHRYKERVRDHSREKERRKSKEEKESSGRSDGKHSSSSYRQSKSDNQSQSDGDSKADCQSKSSEDRNGCQDLSDAMEGATQDSLDQTSSIPECSEEDPINST